MIRRLLSVQAILMRRDRSAWIVAGALLAWGIWEELLDGSRLSFAANFVPLLATWISAWGLRDDVAEGGLDLVLARGVTLPGLILSRALVSAVVGTALLALFVLPVYEAVPGMVREVVGLEAAVLYWAVVGAVAGLRFSSAGVVLLGLATTTLSLLWIYSICPRLSGQMATQGPWLVATWTFQVAGDFFPAGQLTLLREGNLWLGMEVSRGVLALLLLAVGVRHANRVSLRVGS